MDEGDAQRWQRRLDRERQARKQAEALLEQKSLELYQANQELKGVVDALEASSSRLGAILDHTFAGILVVDEQGQMIEVNRAAKAMFGRADDNTVGAVVLDWLDPGSRAICEAAEASRIEADGSRRSEVWHEVEGRRIDGSTFPLEFIITRLDLGESCHQIWILRDLTQQRDADAARKELERDLQRAQKLEALGTMAGGVAHEINTPVQFIGSNTTYLRDVFDDLLVVIGSYRDLRSAALAKADLTEAIAKAGKAEEDADLDGLIADIPDAIAQTEEGVTRVSKIVQAIKEFAHSGGDEQASIDVNRAIDSTIEVSRSEWGGLADLETCYADDLPPIIGDPGKFNEVILNLVINAAQAIEQHNVASKGLIEIDTRLDGQTVAIEIKDNGCGIPQHLHERIFEPFFTTKDVGKGTGQGLALSYKTVTDHLGGTIGLSSDEGEGATFIVRVPGHANIDVASSGRTAR
ncbi:MAG: ATP-binding protein [Geminicoccaceae bacterium]